MTFKPVIKKQITFQLLKLVDGATVHVEITKSMWTGKEIAGGAGKAKMDAARLVRVINLETGEEMEMIINKVLEEIFGEEYPDNAYVGKWFGITKHAKADGKEYNTFTLVELEKTGGIETPVENDKKGAAK